MFKNFRRNTKNMISSFISETFKATLVKAFHLLPLKLYIFLPCLKDNQEKNKALKENLISSFQLETN